MKNNIRVIFLIVLAFSIAIYSLYTSYSVLTSDNGVALVKEDNYKVDLVLNDNVTSSDVIAFEGSPTLEDNNFNFTIGLDTVGSFGQIFFDVENTGDYDAIVKNIEVDGLGEYADYVNVSLVGIQEGQVIESGSLAKNVSIKISYDNDYGSVINLNDIDVKVNIEKV
ncbi:MAG: hypothetical protein IKQ29_00300 [Bacilli bacterium]|nr:hypothetical protein [Bacilli bacterium]